MVQQLRSFIGEYDEDIIEKRLQDLLIKRNIYDNYKIKQKYICLESFDLITYVRVHLLLGEPIF